MARMAPTVGERQGTNSACQVAPLALLKREHGHQGGDGSSQWGASPLTLKRKRNWGSGLFPVAASWPATPCWGKVSSPKKYLCPVYWRIGTLCVSVICYVDWINNIDRYPMGKAQGKFLPGNFPGPPPEGWLESLLTFEWHRNFHQEECACMFAMILSFCLFLYNSILKCMCLN